MEITINQGKYLSVFSSRKSVRYGIVFFTEDMSEEIHSGWLTKSPGSKKVTIFANNITLPIKAVSCSINPHFDKHSKTSAKGTRSTRNVYSFVISAICSSFLKNISVCYQSRSLQISQVPVLDSLICKQTSSL